jgi:ATP-dependent helicase YprA (DUF1998 family)
LEEILEASLELIDQCICRGGCPSCVGSPLPPFSQLDPDVSMRGLIPDKEASKSILHALLQKESYLPSRRETVGVDGTAADPPVQLPETKPLPLPLEKKLRQRVSQLKRVRRPRPR